MNKLKQMALDVIHPNPAQPRKSFDEESLASLAASIAEYGVRDPIKVKADSDGLSYAIVDGERRWRASRMAGKTHIPAIIEDDLDDSQIEFQVALIANLQRKDLNPVEEGNAYKRLRMTGMSIQEIVDLSGRSVTTVRNLLEIAEFPEEIQGFIAGGVLGSTYYTVSAIKSLPEDRRIELARRFVARRSTEATIKRTCQMINSGAVKTQRKARKEAPAMVANDDVAAICFAGDEAQHIIRGHGMAGDNLAWATLIRAVEVACNKRCPLRDGASERDCNGCQLIVMFRELVEPEAA